MHLDGQRSRARGALKAAPTHRRGRWVLVLSLVMIAGCDSDVATCLGLGDEDALPCSLSALLDEGGYEVSLDAHLYSADSVLRKERFLGGLHPSRSIVQGPVSVDAADARWVALDRITVLPDATGLALEVRRGHLDLSHAVVQGSVIVHPGATVFFDDVTVGLRRSEDPARASLLELRPGSELVAVDLQVCGLGKRVNGISADGASLRLVGGSTEHLSGTGLVVRNGARVTVEDHRFRRTGGAADVSGEGTRLDLFRGVSVREIGDASDDTTSALRVWDAGELRVADSEFSGVVGTAVEARDARVFIRSTEMRDIEGMGIDVYGGQLFVQTGSLIEVRRAGGRFRSGIGIAVQNGGTHRIKGATVVAEEVGIVVASPATTILATDVSGSGRGVEVGSGEMDVVSPAAFNRLP